MTIAHTTAKLKNTELVEKILSRLIKAYNPVSVYLFGSYAWGIPDKSSDMDFFVVVDKSSLTSADRIRLGMRELTDIDIAVDIIVFTKDEIAEKKDHLSTLTNKVISKGIKLYEAA